MLRFVAIENRSEVLTFSETRGARNPLPICFSAEILRQSAIDVRVIPINFEQHLEHRETNNLSQQVVMKPGSTFVSCPG
jgi:hypothetical protein